MASAKAVAGFITALVMHWLMKNQVDIDATLVEEVITGIVTAVVVWAVPNRPQPARPPA